MASRKCWSRPVGAQRGNRVRVFERTPGGYLYIEVWEKGHGKKRLSLGHKDRKQALKQAHEVMALRVDSEYSGRTSLTLGVLLERYWNESTHARDGSLKTEGYRKNCAKFNEYLIGWFGRDTPVKELTPNRMEGYVRARRAGQISGRKVRVRSPQIELSYLKSAMRWATGVFENGRPLLAQSPMATYSPPRERDPRRPMVTGDAVQALLKVGS